jgi:hypothetical protein
VGEEEEVGDHAEIAELTEGSMVVGAFDMTMDVGDTTAIVIAMVPTIALHQELDLFVDNFSGKKTRRL